MSTSSKLATKEKRDLLLLHGYLSSGKSFIFQTKFFSNYYNVYAPDLKGFGENKGMEFPYSLDDYIDEVKEYIEKNGLKNPDVIAHSFGGRIAIKLMANDDEIFRRVVLTGSAGLKPRPTLKKTGKKIAFKVLRNFVKKERLTRFYSSDYNMLDGVMKESFKKIVSEHLDDKLKDINNEVLIVFGSNDDQTPVYMAKKLHKNIKNSKLILLPNAGHFCFIDKPARFNMEVREFLLS